MLYFLVRFNVLYQHQWISQIPSLELLNLEPSKIPLWNGGSDAQGEEGVSHSNSNTKETKFTSVFLT